MAIISLFAAFGLYLAMTLVGGTTGFIEYARLQNYQQTVAQHVEELSYRQQLLLAEVRDLQQNDQRLLTEARSVGFYLAGDYVVRLNGATEEPYILTSGTRLPVIPEGRDYRAILRVIALCSGLIIYALGLFFGGAARSSKETIARPSM